MTIYTTLQHHLERHQYTRGKHKGDAPADASKRYKDHFRVVLLTNNTMALRMYSSDLIRVTEDGTPAPPSRT